jgi:hypothetical protein
LGFVQPGWSSTAAPRRTITVMRLGLMVAFN